MLLALEEPASVRPPQVVVCLPGLAESLEVLDRTVQQVLPSAAQVVEALAALVALAGGMSDNEAAEAASGLATSLKAS